MMGGSIGVDSERGKGSEFWFTARFAKQAERPRVPVPAADLNGTHILVVDDNASAREVLLRQLTTLGARPEEASDGPSALQTLRGARDAGDPFAVAILDRQMPGMDGVTLGQVIKSDALLKEIHLVLLTVTAQQSEVLQMGELGFVAHLTKPVRQSELFGRLGDVLAGRAMWPGTPPAAARQTICEINRGAARILLAEDNVTNQQMALGILKKFGLQADAVANGAEAVRAFETIHYDLVLMDVQMPEMDGLEATRLIRLAEGERRKARGKAPVSARHIPIIAMTAYAMHGDRERCLEAGMDDYVSKPVDLQALSGMLRKYLPEETAEGRRVKS